MPQYKNKLVDLELIKIQFNLTYQDGHTKFISEIGGSLQMDFPEMFLNLAINTF